MRVEQIRDIVNFRDLGNYEGADKRLIKEGVFFRSGSLSRLNEKEREYIDTLGIKSIVDLRSQMETLADPDPYFAGVEYLQYSAVVSQYGEQIDFSPAGMRSTGLAGRQQYARLLEYYRKIPFDNEALKIFFKAIKENRTPVIFHCFSGKDRTGVAAMMLLKLLGASDETILADYLLSNDYCKEALTREFTLSKDLLAEDPASRVLLQMMEGVDESIGKAVLAEFNRRYPAAETYFYEQYGFSADDIREIRERYLQ